MSDYNENENPANIFLDTLNIELDNIDIRLGSVTGPFDAASSPAITYDVAIQGYIEDLIQGSYKEKDDDRNKIQAELIINHGTDNTGLSYQDGRPKNIAITALVEDHYYKIVVLGSAASEFGSGDFKYATGHSGTAVKGDIFKYIGAISPTGLAEGDGEVIDITFNKGGFFVIENPKKYQFQNQSAQSLGNLQAPTLSTWVTNPKVHTDGDPSNGTGGWGADWSEGAINFDGSGFGNTKGLYAVKGDAATAGANVTDGSRLCIPDTDGGILRFTTYEGAENSFNGLVKNSTTLVTQLSSDVTATNIVCKTRVTAVGAVVNCDASGDKTNGGSYITYNSEKTSDYINNAVSTTPASLLSSTGSNFISSSTIYPAVDYGPDKSTLSLEYRNRVDICHSICSERFIDLDTIEYLQNRDLETATVSTAKEYQSVGKNAGAIVTTDANILDASLRKGCSSCADACLLAISSALTKQAYGNEIVLNDTALRAKLRREIRRHLNKVFGYDDGTGVVNAIAAANDGTIDTTNSKDTGHHGLVDGGYLCIQLDDDQFASNTSGNLLTQYILNSGRTSQGATAVAQKFDFDNLDFNFLIKLTGQIKDSDIDAPGTGLLLNNTTNQNIINATFGSGGRRDGANVASGATVTSKYQTLVSDEDVVAVNNSAPAETFGKFTVNCMVSIKNIDSKKGGSGGVATAVIANTGGLSNEISADLTTQFGIEDDGTPASGPSTEAVVLTAAEITHI